MRQRARVLETNGKTATVSVSRRTMCEGCEKNGGCGGRCGLSGILASDRTLRATAQNPIGAEPGEIVEVETDSGRVLGYAALVFLLPLAVCALFYFLGTRFFASGAAGTVCAAAGFALIFAGIALFDRRLRSKTPGIRIVGRVNPNDPFYEREE